jgi:hypothetical protein
MVSNICLTLPVNIMYFLTREETKGCITFQCDRSIHIAHYLCQHKYQGTKKSAGRQICRVKSNRLSKYFRKSYHRQPRGRRQVTPRDFGCPLLDYIKSHLRRLWT